MIADITYSELDELSSKLRLVESLEIENPFFPTYKFFKRKLASVNSVQKLRNKLDSWAILLEAHSIPIRNASVLAVGCGCGLECVYLRILGAKEVVGLEADPMFTTGMGRLFESLQVKNEVRPLLQDIHHYEDSERYDVIITVDAVSHMYDYQLYLRQCYRLLNKSGRLLIIDDNNKLNFLRRREVVQIWENWEKKGATYEDQAGVIRRINSYEEDRMEFIREEYPELSPEVSMKLAQRTSGLRRPEIRDAVNEYKRTRQLPRHPYVRGTMAYDSRLDMPKEIQFNPYTFARVMYRWGFRNIVHMPGLIRPSSLSRRLLLRVIRYLRFVAYITYSKGFSISGSKSVEAVQGFAGSINN